MIDFHLKYIAFLILLAVNIPSSVAQFSIKGQISDAQTGEALPFSSVYLANTTIGTTSDKEGFFQLTNIPEGDQELVFAFLGYEALLKKINVNEFSSQRALNIRLKVSPIALETVEVKASVLKKRKRYLKKFTRAFLGQTANASHCKILNPELIQFDTEERKIIATAQGLIEVENRSTGYRLWFYLEKFVMEGQQVHYAGKPFFEELQAENKNEASNWIKRRRKTYLGSPRHFYQSLVKDQLKEEGFKIFLAQQKTPAEFHNIRATRAKAILKEGTKPNQLYLSFNDFLKVVYLKGQKSPRGGNINSGLKGLGQAAERDMIQQSQGEVNSSGNMPTSYLFSRKTALKISPEGRISEPELLLSYGDWALEGIADLLPFDYSPNSTSVQNKDQKTTQDHPKKKGFILSNLTLPLKDIQDGGVPKDGIPAIDQPEFLEARAAEFLGEEEKILGVYHNGIAKAYPIKILDQHEVVNDQFGTTAVALTFCPLCASGIAFLAEADGQQRSFGVSGLLYNSDVLLYDRETESLWSQILGKAISGVSSGSKLEMLPTEHTTWEDWQKRYPQSLVLLPPSDSNYDYEQEAYHRYLQSSELIFPVTAHNQVLSNKEKVIGIEVDGQFKAYPLAVLRKQRSPIKDTFNGRILNIIYNRESHSARIKNEAGKVLNGMTLFWFAWYAFHPDTAIYQ